jgi:hypothetical protein
MLVSLYFRPMEKLVDKNPVMLSDAARQGASHARTLERSGYCRHGVRRLMPLSAILVGAGFCFSISASASELDRKRSERETTEASEIIIDVQSDPRSDFRRALMTSGDYPAAGADRKRLSQEERDLLNREWREAISGIYDRGDGRGLGQSTD